MFMNKLAIALVGATSLALAACTNQDQVDENANADATENLDALAGDAANDAEAEALGNQADGAERRGR